MTNFTVTLKQLRDNKACIDGYNRLVCYLKGVKYVDKSSYIRFKHESDIPLLTILESNGLDDALWCLKCNSEWERDARLFAVWCARQVEHLTDDVRVKNCNDVSERFANGNATKDELEAARVAAREAAWVAAREAAREAARAAAWEAAWVAAGEAAGVAAREAARAAQKEMFILMCNNQASWSNK